MKQILPEPFNIVPSFARAATKHLLDGDIQIAIDLCLAGTKTFPQYATGHLVLGKCYDSFGRTVESLAAYRQALARLPDNPTLQTLVKNAEMKEQAEFHKFVEEQKQRLGELKETIPAEQFLAEQAPEENEESAIEYLAKRLQDVKRIKPNPAAAHELPETPTGGERSLKFVTATIAEIYATQGEYREAIDAYRELLIQHPDEEERYKKRIAEIEQLLAIQQKEKRLDNPDKKKAS